METREQIEARLREFSLMDPISTEQIRPYVFDIEDSACTPPSNEQMRMVSHWITENRGESGEQDIVIALGTGSGREIRALRNLLPPTTRIALFERDPRSAATLFRTLSIEEFVRNGNMIVALGDEPEYIAERFFSAVDIARSPSFRIFQTPGIPGDHEEFYEDLLRLIRNRMHLNIFNLNTLIYRGPQWQFNTLRNLPVIAANPGISSLKSAFKGRPAVITGAGPSLNSTAPFLRSLTDRFVIVATATSVRALRAMGITPDLVVAVDASNKTEPQFDTDCSELFLASSSIAFPPALRKFKGVFSGGLATNPIDEWIDSFRTPRDSIAAAGTVTASAIDLAINMGCNPIVSMGFDLSFSDDGTTHAENTMYHQRRVATGGLVPVPGNYSEEVMTTDQFKCYISLIQDYVSAHPETRFINATLSGARIDGMELAEPRQLEDFAGDAFPAYETLAEIHAAYTDNCSGTLLRQLEKALTQLDHVVADSLQAARICNRLIMILRHPHRGDEPIAQTYLEQLSAIDEKFADARDSSVLLDMSLWPVSYRTNTSRTEEEKDLTEAVLVNKRSRELYEQIAGAAKWTRDLIKSVLDEFRDGDFTFDPVIPDQSISAKHNSRNTGHAEQEGDGSPGGMPVHGRKEMEHAC